LLCWGSRLSRWLSGSDRRLPWLLVLGFDGLFDRLLDLRRLEGDGGGQV